MKNKRLKKVIVATFVTGVLTAIASFNSFAGSTLKPVFHISSIAGYCSGWQSADVIGDARRHYSYVRAGNDSSYDYGYRWTKTNAVASWSTINHGSYWTENY